MERAVGHSRGGKRLSKGDDISTVTGHREADRRSVVCSLICRMIFRWTLGNSLPGTHF